jgi:hypothetical protein
MAKNPGYAKAQLTGEQTAQTCENAWFRKLSIWVTTRAYDFPHAALALHRARNSPQHHSFVLGWRVYQSQNDLLAITPVVPGSECNCLCLLKKSLS